MRACGPECSTRCSIGAGPRAKKRRFTAEAEAIIEFLELEELRHVVVGDLSYGLRKRVDLGRAIALDPKMLIMDEPMAGMNAEEKGDLARFILDIQGGASRFRSCWSSTTWKS